jgi:plasmid stabilization system protein ParE
VLRWSARSRADLKAIHDYIRRDSPLNAKAVVREFLERASQLSATPRAGRIVPELGDATIREVPVYSWRLIYLVRRENVFVLTLIHKRRVPTLHQLRD